MDGRSKMSLSLNDCPAEVLVYILEAIETVDALRNVALSSSRIFSIFKAHEQTIIKSILTNIIGADVLLCAVLTYRCTPPQLKTRYRSILPETDQDSEALNALAQYAHSYLEDLRPPDVASLKLSLEDALALANFHAIVADFTDRAIVQWAKSPHVQLDVSLEERPASVLEKSRVARSFYIFEMYRRVYGILSELGSGAGLFDHKRFFANFSAWELAQLGCTYDFLGSLVLPVFNEVANHDVMWGAKRVQTGSQPEDPHISNVLGFGLVAIHQIATARTFAEKRVSVQREDLPTTNTCFLFHAFQGFMLDYLYMWNFADLLKMVKQTPFYDDGNKGPEEVWKGFSARHTSQQKACHSAMPLFTIEDKNYRGFGFVFWDSWRMEDPRIDLLHVPTWKNRDSTSPVWAANMIRSWKSFDRRDVIYRNGGRGWWDKEDESQVVYS